MLAKEYNVVAKKEKEKKKGKENLVEIVSLIIIEQLNCIR